MGGILSRVLSLCPFIVAAWLVRSLIAQHTQKADPFIMKGIDTSREVTFFPLGAHTVGDEITYLPTTY